MSWFSWKEVKDIIIAFVWWNWFWVEKYFEKYSCSWKAGKNVVNETNQPHEQVIRCYYSISEYTVAICTHILEATIRAYFRKAWHVCGINKRHILQNHGIIGVHRPPLNLGPPLIYLVGPLAILDRHINICGRPPNTSFLWSNFIYYPLTHQFEAITLGWIKTCVKWFWDNSLLMENIMNGHFKSEWTKILLCFFLTKVNIWKFSRIMHMNFSPEFLITVI